jgi:peptidoglycan/LPS O-acetylase OafA/YrhL
VDVKGKYIERPATPRLPGHIRALDGLRGVAILSVLLLHFAGSEVDKHIGKGAGAAAIERIYRKLITQGGAGVDLFFVLSGFLITRILLSERGSPHMLRNFYARRFLRIFPLYYFGLFACLIVLPRLVPITTEAGQAVLSNQHWLWLYLGNFASGFLGISWRGWPIYLAHTWSLAVEEQFYLAWPLLVCLLSRRSLRVSCLISIPLGLLLRVILLAQGLGHASGTFTLCRIDGLLMGAAIAITAVENGHVRRLVPLAFRGLAVTGAVFLGLALFSDRYAWLWWTTAFVHTVYPAFFSALLILVLSARDGSRFKRFWEHGFLTFFGKYSYGIYLNHFILLPFLVQWIPVTELQRLTGSRILGLLLFAMLATVISVAIALLTWNLFERHFLKLKRRFETRPAPAPSDAALAEGAALDLALTNAPK